MEFNIKRDSFLDGVQKTLGIVEKRTTLPILNNVLIKALPEGIRIVATDREIGLVADYDAEVVKTGEITLSARKLHEMIREIQGETVSFVKGEGNTVSLRSNRAVYRIHGLPADDYPSVLIGEDMPIRSIKGGILRDLIRKTSFSMASDDLRRNLNGVFLEPEGPGSSVIRMVATDGHRLAMMRADTGVMDFLGIEKGVIIPRKGLMEIKRLLDDEAGEVRLGVGKGMCLLKTDKTTLRVNLVDGEYPDYRRVLPADSGSSFSVDKEAMLHALRRMSVISSEKYNGVIVTASPGKVVLHSNNPDVGEAQEELDVAYEGEEKSVGYNVNYLTDAVEVIDEERLELEISAGMKPGVVKGVGNENYLSIIMPLKL